MKMIYPGSSIRISICVGLFPANTLITLLRLHSLAFGFGTFAYAKDRASSPHDGLLKESPTPCSHDVSGISCFLRKFKYSKFKTVEQNNSVIASPQGVAISTDEIATLLYSSR